MTVLRSREIASPRIMSKSPAKAVDSGILEPDTPVKTLEGLNTTSPLSLSPKATSRNDKRLETRTVRRRSPRLASQLDVNEGVEIVESLSRKRKRFDAGDEGNLCNGLNLGTPVSEIKQDAGTGLGEVPVDAALEGQNKSNTFADSRTFGQRNDGFESVKQVSRKRKSGMSVELSGLELVGQNQEEKKVLNLCSGRKIVKRGGKHRRGDNSEEIETGAGDKLCSANDNGCMSNGCRGNDDVMTDSEAKFGGAEDNSTNKHKKSIGEDKGKGKVLEEAAFISGVNLLKLKLEDKEADGNITGPQNRVQTRSLRRNDKGKEKLVENGFSSKSPDSIECKSEIKMEKYNEAVASSSSLAEDTSSQQAEQININVTAERRVYKDRFRDIARRNASRFAHFSSQEEEDNNVADVPAREIPPSDIDMETEDWPGPFSTALKIIKDRQMNASVQQRNSSLDKSRAASVVWMPKKDQQRNLQKQLVPSLQDLCLTILVKNADAITSLDCVPDILRHKLSQLLCDSRRMDNHFLSLLVQGSPAEIHLRDCSWLSEEIFTKTFEVCDISKLMVLQLDQCGRCLADYVLFGTLARAPNCLPALTTMSLRAAYRLSDVGLSALVSSAPSLRSINLSQCALLTSDGISGLAASLGSVLRELYLDDCQGIDAMLILSALLKFEHLEVLSLGGVETVCDEFVSKFVKEKGHRMKELILADCMKLTDSSVRFIAEYCSELCAVDLSNLCKLTDTAIGYLANGCRAIQTLKLCRNTFSDEAVAAYLETCGDDLRELSLTNVKQVAQNTAVSLARLSRNLHYLDLSWCRNLTNEALGLIVDGCLSLKVLKLFGCTQVTDVFLLGHSNPEVQIIGLKMKPILEHLKVPDLLQGALRYSSVSSTF